ncbi:type II toxin-antitoxin system VapC family toxin [Saccharolobus shibatae]|uniref:type II toxin-antitoxin system VapC family toxin n=1 Tax=Saccharolobus shibatae TaxID=2286 RepID=UPI0021BC0A4C|nr:type II toxin-antitoxin system VapC family toxin [Saccharolobus shibatae]
MRGKRAYIDTNIFIYVALKNLDFYNICYKVLDMLISGEFKGLGSYLVLFELFGSLSKIDVKAAYEAVNSYLDLPITILETNRDTFSHAKEIAELSGVTYDALHAALVSQNGIEVVITEDVNDWSKIVKAWPKVKEKLNVKDLIVVSPTKGKLM